MKAPEAKIISITAPNAIAFFTTILIPFALFVKGRYVTLKFECGNCGIESIKQWQDGNNYITCPICKTANRVKQ